MLISFGWWRATGVGPQVQVPMFYDAHYFFPRPWIQEQAAPGVPQDTPIAFYGQNRISQPFVSGVNNLSMIEVWLAGPQDEIVTVSLSDDHGRVLSGEVALSYGRDGGIYILSFPPIKDSEGRRFLLTLMAMGAGVEQPVVTRTTGGDRLGGSLQLNEYNRPGNLALKTYAQGSPGVWWLKAISEQILPSVFRLRLQQYKPAALKGLFFSLLLTFTVLLTILYLILARPQKRPTLSKVKRTLGWSIVLILGLFIIWQITSGRVKLSVLINEQVLGTGGTQLEQAPEPGLGMRIIRDVSSDLWTIVREPEERFISTEMFDGLPGIRVPSNSALNYGLNVPPDTHLRGGIFVEGQGNLNIEVQINEEVIETQEIMALLDAGAEDVSWFTVDLSPWAGQTSVIRLVTSNIQGDPDGLWIMPQFESASPWLLPDPLSSDLEIHPGGHRFADSVELVGYFSDPPQAKAGELIEISLYWRALQRMESNATVFAHLVDSDGNIAAQDDGLPVNDAYPLSAWVPGSVVRDSHNLQLPPDLPPGEYRLFVGLYDPNTFERWPVTGPDGLAPPDHAARLDVPVEVTP